MQLLVNCIKAFFCAGFVRKCTDELLFTDEFIDQRSLLPAGFALFAEHGVGSLGNKACDRKRKRRHGNNNKGYQRVDGEHEHECADNGHNPREQLGKAHQKPVRKLIGIAEHTAHGFARRVRIEIGEGQFLNAAECFCTDIANAAVGYAVVAKAHKPLRKCSSRRSCTEFQQKR